LKVYFFGEVVGEILGQVFGYVCYGFGRQVVPFLTAGLVRPAEARDEKLTFPWYGLARGRDGKAVLSDAFTILVGLAMLLILVAALVWVLNASRQPGAS
jgi:hypothetical protein